MVFRWFSSSSLIIPKAPTTIGITVALRSHHFWTCNLKFCYLMIFSSSFTLMFWSPRTAMSMILHSLFYLSMTTISGFRCSISLPFWIAMSQSILHLSFSTTGFGWCENHSCLHIQSEISYIGASVLFFQVCSVSSCICFQLGQNTNCQYGWHFQLSLCRACIAGTHPGDQCHFLLHLL